MRPPPTAAEVLAVLDQLEPLYPPGPSGRRAYSKSAILARLFPRGDERLVQPQGQPHGLHLSPAYAFMEELDLGRAVPGVRGSRNAIWRDADA